MLVVTSAKLGSSSGVTATGKTQDEREIVNFITEIALFKIIVCTIFCDIVRNKQTIIQLV